ncbi:MAG TPA: MarR family transcriptional regulator [Thermomicrobiales bacterium]|nr:MarR family transcriptional regulator [Thermomicrobiales bacterium]
MGQDSTTVAEASVSDLVDRMQTVIPQFQHFARHVLSSIQGDDRVTLQQLRSLQAIAGTDGGMSTTKLAKRLRIASPTVTRIVDGLVDRGMVDRVQDPNDRRRLRLLLLAPGQDLLDQYEQALHARLAVRLHDLPPPSRQRLWDALEDLNLVLDDPDRDATD